MDYPSCADPSEAENMPHPAPKLKVRDGGPGDGTALPVKGQLTRSASAEVTPMNSPDDVNKLEAANILASLLPTRSEPAASPISPPPPALAAAIHPDQYVPVTALTNALGFELSNAQHDQGQSSFGKRKRTNYQKTNIRSCSVEGCTYKGRSDTMKAHKAAVHGIKAVWSKNDGKERNKRGHLIMMCAFKGCTL